MTGSSDAVTIQSVPSGAYFTTNVGISGHTPKVVQVPASQDLIIETRRKGYERATAIVKSRMSKWIAGNLLFGGLIGIVIDLVNPNARTHDGTVTVQLVRAENVDSDEMGAMEENSRTLRASIREVPQEIDIRN